MSEIDELKKKVKEIEEKKEIDELKEKIAKLENKSQSLQNKSIEDNLGSGMKDIGDSFRGMPHIIIPTPGSNKSIHEANSDKPNNLPLTEKEQKMIMALKKWSIVGGVVIVVLYCIYRVLKGWIL